MWLQESTVEAASETPGGPFRVLRTAPLSTCRWFDRALNRTARFHPKGVVELLNSPDCTNILPPPGGQADRFATDDGKRRSCGYEVGSTTPMRQINWMQEPVSIGRGGQISLQSDRRRLGIFWQGPTARRREAATNRIRGLHIPDSWSRTVSGSYSRCIKGPAVSMNLSRLTEGRPVRLRVVSEPHQFRVFTLRADGRVQRPRRG